MTRGCSLANVRYADGSFFSMASPPLPDRFTMPPPGRKRRTMTRGLRLAFAALGGLLVAAQAFRIDRTNPPVEQDVAAPAGVEALLRRACYNCHSHETVWPWYSHVAPVSWLLAPDVSEGGRGDNFLPLAAAPP